MEVPFKVIMDYIIEYQSQTHNTYYKKDSGLFGKLGMSRGSYFNYCGGQRGGVKKPQYPEYDMFNEFFINLCLNLYDVTFDNYKLQAQRMIKYLEINKKISALFIDYKQYAQEIEEEDVPVYMENDPNYDSENDPNYVSEIEKFLKTCYFREFLSNYIKLCNNKDYMNYQFSSNNDSSNSIYKINIDNYMDQSLIDENNQSVLEIRTIGKDNISCNYSFFENNRFSIITGPGGQGKSLFLNVLRMIHSMTENTFDEIIIVPLVDLTLHQKSVENFKKDWIRDYINLEYPDVELKNETRKYLILLDGLNEYPTAKDNKTVDKITKNIKDFISSPDNSQNSFAITTRDEKTAWRIFGNITGFRILKLTGTSDTLYQHIENKCAMAQIPFEGEELSRLARIPLYALLIEHLDDKELRAINSNYKLMDIVYHNRVEQRIGDEARKTAYDKSLYFYLYYSFLPYVAYQSAISDTGDNAYTFSRDDFREYSSRIKPNHLDEILLETMLGNDPKLKAIPRIFEIDMFLLECFLVNEESDIIRQKDSITGNIFQFSHEIWRDYLSAKFLNTVVLALKERYDSNNQNNIICLFVNYNIGADAAKLVLQSFDLCSDPITNASRTEELFKIDSSKIGRCLYASIGLMHTAFDFNDYLKMDLPLGEKEENQCLHKIMNPLRFYLSNNHRYDNAIKSNKLLTKFICEILSKEAEYFRLICNYFDLIKTVELAKRFDPDSDIILNQEAKMYLSCFEKKLKHDTCVIYPNLLNMMGLTDLYDEGIKRLTELASMGFHLSANIAGILKSTVAPVLIKSLPEIKADFCGAFRCYAEVIYRTDYVRRDIAYTIRQAVNLLIKGYVRVSEDSTFDPEDDMTCLDDLKLEVCNPLLSQNINKESLTLSENMIKKANGQELEGLNYLRGAILLYSGQKEKAKPFFESRFKDESTLMSDIQLKYQYHIDGLDNKIQMQFEALIKDIKKKEYGQYDRTHPAYWYIESRELLLSYLDDEELEQEKAYFSDLEKEKPVKEIVNMVFDFIHQK